MSKILCATPTRDGLVHQKTVQSMKSASVKHELIISYTENSSLITKARQDYLTRFLKSDCDYLLFVDSDMVIGGVGALDGMIDRLPPNSICVGGYSMKAHDQNGNCPFNGCTWDEKPITKFTGELIKMKYAPTGFMLIPRAIAEKVTKAYENLAYEDYINGKCWAVFNCVLEKDSLGIVRYLPEDFSFSARLSRISVDIWLDPNVQLGHVGAYLYSLRHLY